MAATGLDVFDKTLQTTHIWLDEIGETLGPDRQVNWHALGAVLHALRDRVPPDLAVHLGAQLPLLVRGLYYDQWHLAFGGPGIAGLESRPGPERARTVDEFLERVGEGLRNIRPVNVRDATRAVFRTLSRHVDAGQIRKVRESLPEPVRNFWLSAEEPGPAANEPGGRRERGGTAA